MNKTHSLKHFVYLVGMHIYYRMIHGPYNVKFMSKCFHFCTYIISENIFVFKYIISTVYGFNLKAYELETWPVKLGNEVLRIIFVTE